MGEARVWDRLPSDSYDYDVARKGWFCARNDHVLVLNMRTYRTLIVVAVIFGMAVGLLLGGVLLGAFDV